MPLASREFFDSDCGSLCLGRGGCFEVPTCADLSPHCLSGGGQFAVLGEMPPVDLNTLNWFLNTTVAANAQYTVYLAFVDHGPDSYELRKYFVPTLASVRSTEDTCPGQVFDNSELKDISDASPVARVFASCNTEVCNTCSCV